MNEQRERVRDPQQALQLLGRLGFTAKRHQPIGQNLVQQMVIRFEHPPSGTEFEWTMDQWELIEPFFSSSEAEAASKVSRLRSAAREALDLLEERTAPERKAAEALRDALT